MYTHAKPLASLVRKLQPAFFNEDFKFIDYLGEATDLREVSAYAADFQDANFARRGFWRTRLRIRVSGRKATRLAQRLFSQSRQSAVA